LAKLDSPDFFSSSSIFLPSAKSILEAKGTYGAFLLAILKGFFGGGNLNSDYYRVAELWLSSIKVSSSPLRKLLAALLFSAISFN
jgi:hypothetical protein